MRHAAALALCLALSACTGSQATTAANTGNAIVRYAKQVCRAIGMLPDNPIPLPAGTPPAPPSVVSSGSEAQ